MDSIRKLLKNEQFELVIKLTENCDDSESLMMRLQAFYSLGNDQKALELIKNNINELIEFRLPLMEIHFNILFEHKLYKNINSMIDFYDSLPYFSYEAEEFIKEQREKLNDILFEEPKVSHKLDVEEIKELILHPSTPNEMAYTFDMIRSMNVKLFLPEIKQFLVSEYDELIKTFALLVLVDQQVNEEVNFLKNGVCYKVIPLKLTPPFTDQIFDELCKMILGRIKDPSVSNVAIQLLNAYIMAIYPSEINDDELDLLSTCFTIVASNYLSADIDTLELANQYGLDEEQIEAKIDEINEILANK